MKVEPKPEAAKEEKPTAAPEATPEADMPDADAATVEEITDEAVPEANETPMSVDEVD